MRIPHLFHLCRHSLAKVYNDLIWHNTSLLFIQKENRLFNGESGVKVVKGEQMTKSYKVLELGPEVVAFACRYISLCNKK